MNKKGFTLVELLIAASLFLAATLAFGYLLKLGLLSVENATKLNHAAYALQTKMEELRSLPFEDVERQNGGSFAAGKGKVQVAPALANLVSIKIELEWDPRRAPLKLYALRSKY